MIKILEKLDMEVIYLNTIKTMILKGKTLKAFLPRSGIR
jgi:hypothetical protein